MEKRDLIVLAVWIGVFVVFVRACTPTTTEEIALQLGALAIFIGTGVATYFINKFFLGCLKVFGYYETHVRIVVCFLIWAILMFFFYPHGSIGSSEFLHDWV